MCGVSVRSNRSLSDRKLRLPRNEMYSKKIGCSWQGVCKATAKLRCGCQGYHDITCFDRLQQWCDVGEGQPESEVQHRNFSQKRTSSCSLIVAKPWVISKSAMGVSLRAAMCVSIVQKNKLQVCNVPLLQPTGEPIVVLCTHDVMPNDTVALSALIVCRLAPHVQLTKWALENSKVQNDAYCKCITAVK